MKHTEKKGLCGICSAGCWIVATVNEQGKIVAVRADEDSPMGITCKIGEHSSDIIYAKDRLLTPLKRRGKKGSYKFDPIS